ncbi:MAG: response regulator [Chloroflexota bacterium]|nr:response regulator [Chloroflexota bacterium]
MSKGRILVVEDNLDNMTLIMDVLQSLGYETVLARDGEEGLRMAGTEKPDLVLMDLSLPKMDGWTATRKIKANPEIAHIPVIALTAHAMVGDRDRALEAGCDDYLTKPLNLRELAQKLTQFIEQGRG